VAISEKKLAIAKYSIRGISASATK